MHYTAGHSDEDAVRTFKTPSAKVSAHLVIGRDGKVTNMKAFNVKTWHAGPSKYAGYSGLNGFSIGIEIVNLGFLRKVRSGKYETWAGTVVSLDDDEVMLCRYPKAGSGDLYWQKYTDAQLEALDQIVPLLVEKYPIQDIVSHEEIDTRGWKVDPGPAFPMMRYKRFLDDRSADEDARGETRGEVTASSLNVRTGPSIHSEIAGSRRRGDKVTILSQNRDWYEITLSQGVTGWVHSDFVRKL
jgi:N-acetylmuramoyl-L-alanine amidase